MNTLLKTIFFSCLIFVSYGASADISHRQTKQFNEFNREAGGPDFGSDEWNDCREKGFCQNK